MPRQRSRSTSPEVRDRNTRDILGRPGLAGMVRTGGRAGSRGNGQRSVIQNPLPESDGADATGSAQLLVMSVTGDSIASGGDYVGFSSIVAQHGFDTVPPFGGAWVHPFGGVYSLTYEHAWDTFTGGGIIRLELDDVLVPEGVIADAITGQRGAGGLEYVAEAGDIGRVWIEQLSGSAQTCDAVLRIAITNPDASVVQIVEVFPVTVAAAVPTRSASPTGETFVDVTVDAPWNGLGTVYVSSSPLGASAIYVDDQIIVDVTHEDGSTATFSAFPGASGGPYDVTTYLEPGANDVRVRCRDTGGANVGSSDLYLVKV